MSDPSLPADPNQWPTSPYPLLGITPADDAKTVKRAYQKLIRVYRPEDHPEQFRRLREAYESAHALASMMDRPDEEPIDSDEARRNKNPFREPPAPRAPTD